MFYSFLLSAGVASTGGWGEQGGHAPPSHFFAKQKNLKKKKTVN